MVLRGRRAELSKPTTAATHLAIHSRERLVIHRRDHLVIHLIETTSAIRIATGSETTGRDHLVIRRMTRRRDRIVIQ